MPPTFGTNPDLVQAIMAGGRERDPSRSAKASRTTTKKAHASMSRLRPTKKDVVVGVSASGMTQFVRGALTRARKRWFEDHLRHVRSADRACRRSST